jgi:hypothetical protein
VSSQLVRAAADADADAPVNYARDIQPILADNCYFCHGPDGSHRKADLRLDTLDPKLGPFAKRDGYEVLKPGSLDDSVLISRITSDDPDVHMPPPNANRHLTEKQIALIKRWVEQGAKWGKLWSLEVPKRPDVPEDQTLKRRAWPRNPIDRFILARLEKEGIEPSDEAPKETLIRRVTLDLTGLPPTTQEVDAFLADTSGDAYEKVVDRLLASPGYGEHMAWEWMDLARYADTNGYQNDPTRTMWPWRDWVAAALNRNLPYDQFATWQLAGDLLRGATPEQRLASGFNRNHPYNGEGGRIAEETRVENVLDRADTTATAFLGLTMGCAKCHDHKYDPIAQKEYYSFYAYFNQCSETGEGKYVSEGNVAPTMTVASPEQQARLAELKRAVKNAEAALAAELPKVQAKQKAWEESARYEKGWIVATPASAKSTAGATMKVQEDSSVLVTGADPDTDVHEVVLRTDLPKLTAIRIEPMSDESLPHQGPGRSELGNFVLTEVEASLVPLSGEKKQPTPLKFSAADATFAQGGFDIERAIDGDAKTGWAVLNVPEKNKLQGVFRFAEPVTVSPGGAEIRVKLHYGAAEHKHHTMGRFRLALTDGAGGTIGVTKALATAPQERTDAQKKKLTDFFRKRMATELKSLNDAVAAAKKAQADFEAPFPKFMLMDDATPRETHLRVNGSYDKPADKV